MILDLINNKKQRSIFLGLPLVFVVASLIYGIFYKDFIYYLASSGILILNATILLLIDEREENIKLK